jgi:hypothetical protein
MAATTIRPDLDTDYRRGAGLGNLSSAFSTLATRPAYKADAAWEIINNSLSWLEATDLDPREDLDKALAAAGQDREKMRRLILRNRDMKLGDAVKIPYSPDHIVTSEDIAFENNRRLDAATESLTDAFDKVDMFTIAAPGKAPALTPENVFEGLSQRLKKFEGTSLDPRRHLDEILERAGKTREEFNRLLLRNRDVKPGDKVDIPYAGSYTVRREDLTRASLSPAAPQ